MIDLGDVRLVVLHLPGHTPGSIGLFDEASGALFSGDAIYDGPLLDDLPESDPQDYVETMKALLELPVNVVYAGHDQVFGRDRLTQLATQYIDGRASVPVSDDSKETLVTHPAIEPYLEQFDLLDKPLDEARGLPNAFYTDPELFALEQERIFRRSWMVSCFVHDLTPGIGPPDRRRRASPLSSLPTRGESFVLSTTCRPSMAVRSCFTAVPTWMPSSGRTTGGAGVSAVHYRLLPTSTGEPIARRRRSRRWMGISRPVAVATWHDLVFVNLSPEPAPFESYIAPLVERLHGTDLGVFIPARHPDGSRATSQYEVRGNWKIVFENDVELLHEPFVHAFYRAHPEISPKVDAEGRPTAVEVSDRGLYGFNVPATMYFDEEFLSSGPCAITAAGERFPEIHIYDAYPNLAIGLAPNSLTFTIIEPLAADHTRMTNYYYVHRDTAPGPEALAELEETIDIYEGARIEDDVVVESVQRGRMSSSFGSTAYSPFWFSLLRDFHRQVRDDLTHP